MTSSAGLSSAETNLVACYFWCKCHWFWLDWSIYVTVAYYMLKTGLCGFVITSTVNVLLEAGADQSVSRIGPRCCKAFPPPPVERWNAQINLTPPPDSPLEGTRHS